MLGMAGGPVSRGASSCHSTRETFHCVLAGWPPSGLNYLTQQWVRTALAKHLPKNKGSPSEITFTLRDAESSLGI